MISQQEYENFVAKLSKTAFDLNAEFEKLSVENQKRFAENMNVLLESYGFAAALKYLQQDDFR